MKSESLNDYVRDFRKRFGDKSGICKTLASYEQGKINMEEAIEQIGTVFMPYETVKKLLLGLDRDNVFVLERKNENS